MSENNFRAGFVGVVGLPNAGKSTLVNELIGEKVGIVSSKPQTTRGRCMGILSSEEAQFVFVDSPGYIEATHGLNHFLHQEYHDVVKDVDVLMLVLNLDAKSPEELVKMVERVAQTGKPWFIVMTKADQGRRRRVEPLRMNLHEYSVEKLVFSKLWPEEKKEVVKEKMRGWIKSHLPNAEEPLFPVESYTNQTLREMISELIREKAFCNLNQEIPYGIAVQVIQYKEGRDGDRISADLLVQKDSHKKIVIGAKGQTLKRIGMQARMEFSKTLGKAIHLQLHVRCTPWLDQSTKMKELGYVSQA